MALSRKKTSGYVQGNVHIISMALEVTYPFQKDTPGSNGI